MNDYPESTSNLDFKQYAIDHVVDGIYWCDERSRIQDVNDGASRMVGYSREELTSMTVGELNSNFPVEKWPAYWEQVKRLGSIKFEDFHRHKDGHLINVEISANFIDYSGKEIICAFVRDITERKLTEKALIESRAILSGVVNNTPDIIFVKDLEGRHQLINDAAEHLIGKPREAVIGHDCMSIFPPDQARRVMGLDAQIVESGETITIEELITVGGVPHTFLTTKGPMRDENGSVIGTFGIARDITARKRDQRMLEMMKFSMDHMADKVTWVTSDAKVVYANLAACSSLGYTMEEMLNLSVPDFDPDYSAEIWPTHWEELKKYGSFTFESRHCTKSGEIYPVEVSINYMRFGDEEYNCGFARDISKRKKIEEELQLSSMVLQTSSEGMLVTDENNQIISINPAFSNITGYSFEEVKGKNPKMFKSDRHAPAFYQAMWQEITTTGKWQGEIWDKNKYGEIQAKWLTINTIRNKDGSIHRYVALFSDITEKKKSEELIWRQANFDTLTGLPNRDMFRDRLGQEVKKSIRAELPLALLLIDLDQFKEVNDTLGHAVGDMLLKDAARRIRACVRESDTVARLGGDEFTVVLSEISDTSHADDVAQKIISRLAEPFHLGHEVVYISASIGITLYPNDSIDIDALMKNADQAMYVAKNKGRNRFSYFTASLQDSAQNRLRLTNDLRGAMEAGKFSIHFQPIVALSTGRIHKAEAVIRWHHPERGTVSPAEFIPLAEETGLIHEIGDWVFKESARWAKHWRNQFTPDFQVSVNKSPVQFRTENYHNASRWSEYLQELGLPGESIVIEITEGLLLNAEANVTDELLRLGDAGIQVAIDDFGTGYSSLSYLKKFDIDYLKIDRSFVSNLETDENDMALSEAIIVMAHKLGLKVIAEGVETEGQRSFLTAAGCDYAQGYLFSKPVPPAEFEKLLIAQGR
jgi:diguanylate cyclase (GGDEF)-like protein/PAS domain S-box-containing protein